MEREKQELKNFRTLYTQTHDSSRMMPKLIETPQITYVNKVLFPQRVNKGDQTLMNTTQKKEIKNTINIDLNKKLLGINSFATSSPLNSKKTFPLSLSKLQLPVRFLITLIILRLLKSRLTSLYPSFRANN
jgi:hypothetical protein